MDLLESKNWKERHSFYTSIDWSAYETDGVLTKISNETTVPALEAALTALISCPDLSYEATKNIIKNINNIKLKEKYKQYFLQCIKLNSTDMECITNDITNALRTLKHNKTLQIYSELLIGIANETGTLNFDESLIEFVLGNSDPLVRKEGINLCLCAYNFKGDSIIKKLCNVKEIQMKEIREIIFNYEKDKSLQNKEINKEEEHLQNDNIFGISDGRGNCKIDVDNEKIQNPKNDGGLEINGHIANKGNFAIEEVGGVVETETIKFYKEYKNRSRTLEIPQALICGIKSASYKDRLEAFKALQENDYYISGEVLGLILLKVNDPNLQVCSLAIECCLLLKINKDIIKTLFERMKERRFKNTIMDVLLEKEVTSRNVIEAFDPSTCKNPQMKCGILEFISKIPIDEYSVQIMLSFIDDSNKDVRAAAMNLISKIMETEYIIHLPEKMQSRFVNRKTSLPNTQTDMPEIKKANSLKVEMTPSKNDLMKSFFDKYSFLHNTNPVKRYEQFIESNIVQEKDFVEFSVIYKDAFYKTNLVLLDGLLACKIEKGQCKKLFDFWMDKIGDSKLRNKIEKFIIHLSVIESSLVLVLLQDYVISKQCGKLFIEGVTILGIIGDASVVNFLSKLERKGPAEKEAIKNAIFTIERRSKNISMHEEPGIHKGINNPEYKMHGIQTHKQELISTKIKRKHAERESIIIKQRVKNRPKDFKNREIVFHEDFLMLMQDPGKFKEILGFFLAEDMVYLSDYIIDFVYKNDLISVDNLFTCTFLDSLIECFILNDYVLKECEITMLYEVVKSTKRLVDKLQLIYPKSKLDRIIRNRGNIEELNATLHSFTINASNISSPATKLMRKSPYRTINIASHMHGTKENSFLGEESFCNENLQIEDILHPSQEEIKPQENTVLHEKPFLQVCNDNEAQFSVPINSSNNDVSSRTDTTDNIEKYRREFCNEKVNNTCFDRITLERVLLNLIHSDPAKCESAFTDLNNIIDASVQSLLFSCNSVISSILIQLNDTLFRNQVISLSIVETLRKLCNKKEFITQLSFSSLRAINIELINILARERNWKTEEPGNEFQVSVIYDIVGDIILSVCKNADFPTILKVYLSMIELMKDNQRQTLYKIIWKHSKNTINIVHDSLIVQKVLDTIHEYLEKNCLKVIRNDKMAIQAIQLHLNELCEMFKEKIYEYRIDGIVKKIIDRISCKANLKVSEISDKLDSIRRNKEI